MDGLWARGQPCVWYTHARKQSQMCTVKHCIMLMLYLRPCSFFLIHGVVQNEGSCTFLKNSKCYIHPLPLTGGQHSHEVWELNKETAVSFLHSESVHFTLHQENLCFFSTLQEEPELFFFFFHYDRRLERVLCFSKELWRENVAIARAKTQKEQFLVLPLSFVSLLYFLSDSFCHM